MIHGGGNGKPGEIHHGAGGQHDLTLEEILATRAYMLPLADWIGGANAIAFQASRILLEEHRICSRRYRRAGEDAYSLALADCSFEGMASGRSADDLQFRAGRCRILETEGIAIHSRGIEGRLRQARCQIPGQHPTVRHIERNAFETMKRRRTVQQARLCFGNG